MATICLKIAHKRKILLDVKRAWFVASAIKQLPQFKAKRGRKEGKEKKNFLKLMVVLNHIQNVFSLQFSKTWYWKDLKLTSTRVESYPMLSYIILFKE